jgi:hypothetical protein
MTTPLLHGALKYGAPCAIAFGLSGVPEATADDFRRLSNAQMQRLITGKIVTDDIHYTDHFKAGGSYEGVFMNKRSVGVWVIKDGQLCVTRNMETPQCDEFWKSGNKLERRKRGLPNVREEVVVRSK